MKPLRLMEHSFIRIAFVGIVAAVISVFMFTSPASAQVLCNPALECCFTMDGYVRDNVTDEAVVGWTMVLRRDGFSGPVVATTTTDSDGYYSFTAPGGSYYDVQVYDPGGTWQWGSSASSGCPAVPPEVRMPTAVVIYSPARLEGYVRDIGTGEGVGGARIVLSGTAIGTAITDSNGYYSFSVPRGPVEYTVQLTLLDGTLCCGRSMSGFFTGTLITFSDFLIDFTPTNPPPSAIQVVLSRYPSGQLRATIAVTNPTDDPLPDVMLTLVRASSPDGTWFVDGVLVPQALGTIAPGQSVAARVVSFPGTSGVPGGIPVLVQVDLSCLGDTYTETIQVVTP